MKKIRKISKASKKILKHNLFFFREKNQKAARWEPLLLRPGRRLANFIVMPRDVSIHPAFAIFFREMTCEDE